MAKYRIESIRTYIMDNISRDSDFWSIGGGNQEIQKRLNDFSPNNWKSLKKDISEWNNDEIDLLIDAIAFGFDGMFTPFLNKEIISEAGKFLLDLFILNIGHRDEIAYFSFFIAQSQLTDIKDLNVMKDWLRKNGYGNENWLQSEINPIGNIEMAIKNASW